MSFVIFGRPVGWKGTFVSTGARKKKSKERSFAYFTLRTISIIHSSFPLGVLFLFPLVSDCREDFQIAIA